MGFNPLFAVSLFSGTRTLRDELSCLPRKGLGESGERGTARLQCRAAPLFGRRRPTGPAQLSGHRRSRTRSRSASGHPRRGTWTRPRLAARTKTPTPARCLWRRPSRAATRPPPCSAGPPLSAPALPAGALITGAIKRHRKPDIRLAAFAAIAKLGTPSGTPALGRRPGRPGKTAEGRAAHALNPLRDGFEFVFCCQFSSAEDGGELTFGSVFVTSANPSRFDGDLLLLPPLTQALGPLERLLAPPLIDDTNPLASLLTPPLIALAVAFLTMVGTALAEAPTTICVSNERIGLSMKRVGLAGIDE